MKLLLAVCLLISINLFSQEPYLFVGTYTNNGSKGIYVYKFDTKTGNASLVSNTDSIVNPSYLTIAPDNKYVYAVTETATNNNGSISAFAFDHNTGRVSFLNKQSSGGANPCYITIDKTNKWIVVANYTGGSVSIFAINKDGSLGPYSQLIQFAGNGVNKARQEKSHVHAAVFSPDEKFIFTPDLGTDKVMIYKFDRSKKQPLTAASTPYVTSTAGSGPRHFTFHPNSKWAYLIEELSGTVVSFKYRNGTLNPLQRTATHPSTFNGTPGSADIHISPDGKFLYASNRGEENNIAIFSINKSTGLLTAIGYQSTEGKTPRNFVIDPTGTFLLAANQNTNNVVVFRRDAKTGMLQKETEFKVPTPVCLKFMK